MAAEQNEQPAQGFDVVGQITAFEEGQLNEAEVAELFQYLADTGIIWSLQGSYQRALSELVALGWVTVK